MALDSKMVFDEIFQQKETVQVWNSICKMNRLSARILDSNGSSLWTFSEKAPGDNQVTYPISYQGIFLGELQLWPQNGKSRRKSLLDKTAEALLNTLQLCVANEYELENLSEEILDKYEEINLLFEMSESLGAIFELQLIYEILLDKIVQALDVKKASILSYDEANDRLVLEASRGLPNEIIKIVVPIEGTVSGYVLRRGTPLLVEDIGHLPEEIHPNVEGRNSSFGFISVPMLCSPVMVRDKRIGVINVTDRKDGRPFSTNDLMLLNSISSIAAISIYNAHLIEELKDTERVHRELEIAETIQMGLLPSQPPTVIGLDIYGDCKTAKNVGGDYFDYFKNEQGSVDIIIADVSGHSIGSALMMAISRSVMRSVIQQENSVADILKQTNHLLFPDLDRAGLFISLFLGRYNPQTRWFSYGNAGHPPLLVYKAATKEVIELDAEGMIIGILDQMEFEEKNIRLDVGDIIVFYTDGIMEAVNPYKEQFGLDRLAEIIKIFHDESARDIVNNLYNQLDIFVNRKEQEDDVTVIVAKVTE